jgi:ribose transport system substrate-binding protein
MIKNKKLCLVLSLLLVFSVLFTACGAPKEEAKKSEASTTAVEKTAEPAKTEQKSEVAVTDSSTKKTNVSPAEKGDKALKIAAICVQNNPFWFPVKDGVMYAKELLEQRNATVDFITVDDFDAKKFNDAIETCITKQYDAITVVGVSDAIVPAINKAVDAGIIVNTFNCEPDKASKRTAFFGQDLYAAGVKAGETVAEEIGKSGKVAIITGLFSVPAHELRRKGALESLKKYPDIKVVGEVENKDKAETAYSQAKDFLTANPDLKAIYVTAGGPFGAAKAIEEMELTGKVKIVCFDFVDETIQYVRKGVISATIGQDPFGQGFDPIVYAYNQLRAEQKPPQEKMWTRLDVVTKDNVDELIGPAK